MGENILILSASVGAGHLRAAEAEDLALKQMAPEAHVKNIDVLTPARGAAMAIVNPIPGQESRNSDYLLENGAAIKINTTATMSYKLTKLLNDPKRLANLKKNSRAIAWPRAAFDIAYVALKLKLNKVGR